MATVCALLHCRLDDKVNFFFSFFFVNKFIINLETSSTWHRCSIVTTGFRPYWSISVTFCSTRYRLTKFNFIIFCCVFFFFFSLFVLNCIHVSPQVICCLQIPHHPRPSPSPERSVCACDPKTYRGCRRFKMCKHSFFIQKKPHKKTTRLTPVRSTFWLPRRNSCFNISMPLSDALVV